MLGVRELVASNDKVFATRGLFEHGLTVSAAESAEALERESAVRPIGTPSG